MGLFGFSIYDFSPQDIEQLLKKGGGVGEKSEAMVFKSKKKEDN